MFFYKKLFAILLVAGLGLQTQLVGAVSLDEAVTRVRQQTGGRVLSAETRQQDGAAVHQIRVLINGGKVKRFRIHEGRKRRPGGKRR